jgi:hypothetical protein
MELIIEMFVDICSSLANRVLDGDWLIVQADALDRGGRS